MPAYDTDLVSDTGSAHNPDLALRCPRCKKDMKAPSCSHCLFHMEFRNGILLALPPDRSAYYGRFIQEYGGIRAAEGRSSKDDVFYLSLPYQDTTGHNSHQWKIRSRSYDYLLQHVLKKACRQGAMILDAGAGNCWMSYRLALQGFRPVAVDLLTNSGDGLGAARHYDVHLPEPFPRIQAEASRLPFQDKQFDAVIFNASFHYAEDYEATLREAMRCLKPRGLIVITDTPLYSREESGRRMVKERQSAFLRRFGTASDSVRSLEYLTPERLETLEKALSIRWTEHRPFYGLKWALRPLIAKLRRRREPSRFRIYTAIHHG